jgi:protein involved in polysaccharide export with SLBB domain
MRIRDLVLLSALLILSLSLLSAQELPESNLIPIAVSITGDIARPGIYTLTTLNRLSDAIKAADRNLVTTNPILQQYLTSKPVGANAEGLTVLPDSLQETTFNKRNVLLTRNGKQQSYDLLRFFRLGDMEQNPYLRDGDVIFVSPTRQTVTLQGNVYKAGEYEFRSGESVRQLLELALGVMENAALGHAILYNYKPGFTEFEKRSLDLSAYPDGSSADLNIILQPGDRLVIPTDAEYRKAYKVTVNGKVRLPGMYYVDDKTTLYELLVMCGGPTSEADLRTAFVYSKTVSGNSDPDFQRLAKYAYSQMTWLEYSYLRTATRQLKGKYSVRVDQCWNSQGKEANLVLRDGDELYVPEQLNGVWVAGQVRNPGLITWQKDMKWKDYIAASGGYANNRKTQGIRIIRVTSGNWVKPTDKLSINPGDIIFIPDKEERYTWDYVKEGLLLASQLLTIIIAIRTF